MELKKGDYEVTHTRVQTAEEMRAALRDNKWDLIISDYTMPRFSAHGALEIARELAPDIPFIVVSGTVSEEVAVEVMRAGAQDFMSKSKLLRLLPAIKRELNEAARRSAHRLVEQQLRQSQKMEAVGQLTGGIAHDFNNLLSVVVGNIEILLDHVTDNPQAQTLANDALNGALHGAELTRRLLAFSRQAPLSTQLVDINKSLSNILVMLRRTIGERIEIRAEPGDTLWEVKLDPSQLEDAIVNLAINARDAMPDGGTLTIATRNVDVPEGPGEVPEGLAGKDCLMISVRDTGIGMTPEVVERAMEPFFTTKGEGKGTGLGLSMVYGFIKQSGGRVQINSEPGKGTVISLFLPRANQDSATSPNDQRLSATAPRGSETILIVEDNPSLRPVVKGLLEGLGYKTIEAETGAQALTILDTHAEIDLLLTDIGLPGGMTGFQLAERAQARTSSLKVLYTTGYAKSVPENFG
ncbi:MAG TPA: response regulator, partial [Dongiaceae bacterium]|nr:response regulator [Dongiaceae bacterium]